MAASYVHGYSGREAIRLVDQATSLADLLHVDTRYAPGSLVLEAGCGVGAQTLSLAANSPHAEFISIDIVDDSLAVARARVAKAGLSNVTIAKADLFHLPYPAAHFDHVFVCFLLEHLPDPGAALRALLDALKPGGSITVIEGDHGSTYFHPRSAAAQSAIDALVQVQAEMGGDALIGRRLYPLLIDAGYGEVQVSPRMVYIDAGKPALVEGFTRNTFIAMVEGVRDEAVGRGLIDAALFDRGIQDLERTTEPDGTFIYTFFKAWGWKT